MLSPDTRLRKGNNFDAAKNFVPQTHPVPAKASGCQWKHFNDLWIGLLYRMVSARGGKGRERMKHLYPGMKSGS